MKRAESSALPAPGVAMEARALAERLGYFESLKGAGIVQEGVHYGPPFPGAKKNVLLLPGAQLLKVAFGFRTEATVRDDLESGTFLVRVDVFSGEVKVADGFGLATARETKFRRKTAEGRPADTADVLNTVLKIAVKRAFVAAILNATGLAGLLDQDLEEAQSEEETVIEGEVVVRGTARTTPRIVGVRDWNARAKEIAGKFPELLGKDGEVNFPALLEAVSGIANVITPQNVDEVMSTLEKKLREASAQQKK